MADNVPSLFRIFPKIYRSYRPQHFLYFLPLPNGQGSFLPILGLGLDLGLPPIFNFASFFDMNFSISFGLVMFIPSINARLVKLYAS